MEHTCKLVQDLVSHVGLVVLGGRILARTRPKSVTCQCEFVTKCEPVALLLDRVYESTSETNLMSLRSTAGKCDGKKRSLKSMHVLQVVLECYFKLLKARIVMMTYLSLAQALSLLSCKRCAAHTVGFKLLVQ